MSSKEQIIDFIKKYKLARPIDLVGALNITPQAIHRHLKSLVSQGVIEPRGGPPKTCYVLADVVFFDEALAWYRSKKEPPTSPLVCEYRDIFAARLSQIVPFEKKGLSKIDTPLVIAIAGEIGNNSFDHNLGHWQDIPGCWFEVKSTKRQLWILIADRGQGILSSLSKIFPALVHDQDALEKAFSERVSGRSPEQRGNGLKFVKEIVGKQQRGGFACISGAALVSFGEFGHGCVDVIKGMINKNRGTITLITWGLS